MINGVDIIFIIPPVALIIAALSFGLWRFSKGGAKGGFTSFLKVIFYGGIALFLLFLIWTGIYYASGGH